jgi:hypothetical protein
VDADAWLESLDPCVLDGWIAYDRLEPISSPWQHTATLCMVIWEAMSAIAAGHGVKLPERKLEDFMPSREPGQTTGETQQRIDPEHLEAVLRRRFGV